MGQAKNKARLFGPGARDIVDYVPASEVSYFLAEEDGSLGGLGSLVEETARRASILEALGRAPVPVLVPESVAASWRGAEIRKLHAYLCGADGRPSGSMPVAEFAAKFVPVSGFLHRAIRSAAAVPAALSPDGKIMGPEAGRGGVRAFRRSRSMVFGGRAVVGSDPLCVQVVSTSLLGMERPGFEPLVQHVLADYREATAAAGEEDERDVAATGQLLSELASVMRKSRATPDEAFDRLAEICEAQSAARPGFRGH